MTPEAVAVRDAEHPAFGMGMFHRLPQTMQVLERIAESFRTGVGLDYDAFGPEGAAGIERSFGPWYRNFLVPVALPALDGVVERLEAGAKVIDIGCGAGLALLTMAAGVSPGSTATTSRVRASAGAVGVRAGTRQRRVPPGARGAHPLGRIGRLRDDVRLHPRHDRPGRDDGDHPLGDQP
jgi:hypothetical protein